MSNIVPFRVHTSKRPEPLNPVACFPWCAHGTGHTEGAARNDQWCTTRVTYVPTALYPAIREDDGTHTSEFVKVYGRAHHHGLAERIHVGLGEDLGIELTPSEARQLAASLLSVATEMEARR